MNHHIKLTIYIGKRTNGVTQIKLKKILLINLILNLLISAVFII